MANSIKEHIPKMPKTITPLSDAKCEAAKPKDKDYSLFDGQGLFMLVKVSGLKVWRFKYKSPRDKRPCLATFGRYPALSLKAARTKRVEYLTLLAQGIDPVQQAKEIAKAATLQSELSFERVALEWFAEVKGKWKPAHAASVKRKIELYLFPMLAGCSVVDLKTRDLLAPLKLVENKGFKNTASRLNQYTFKIMKHAVKQGYLEHNPALDLQGAIEPSETQHRPALQFNRLPELLSRISASNGRLITKLALQLTLLTFVRSSELRFARWDEVDFERVTWTIPATREAIEGVKHSERGAKMKTPHIVPLCRQALAIFEQLRELTGRFELIFAGDHDHTKPMSENTLNHALKRMGYDTKTEVCGHGLRTTACSAMNESGLFDKDAVERQMSHQERDSVRAAYIHKAEYLQQRRIMMQWWADYLDANQQTHITPYDFANQGEGVSNIVRFAKG